MKNKLTVLYVEDNDVLRENFHEIFSTYFNKVISTDNGLSALELYNNNHFDIAILDISIPKINGLDLAAKIRKMDKDIQIVMMSAYSDQKKLLQAVNLQIYSYLVKPVKHKELDTTMNTLVKKLTSVSRIDFMYNYSFDIDKEMLFYKNQFIKTTKNEKKLIIFLCSNNEKYNNACEISNAIFDTEHNLNDNCNNAVQLISRFKKKVLQICNENNFFIDNIYGLGYKV